jgi:hypothetical protein
LAIEHAAPAPLPPYGVTIMLALTAVAPGMVSVYWPRRIFHADRARNRRRITAGSRATPAWRASITARTPV